MDTKELLIVGGGGLLLYWLFSSSSSSTAATTTTTSTPTTGTTPVTTTTTTPVSTATSPTTTPVTTAPVSTTPVQTAPTQPPPVAPPIVINTPSRGFPGKGGGAPFVPILPNTYNAMVTAAAAAGSPNSLTPDQWNYYLAEVINQPAPDVLSVWTSPSFDRTQTMTAQTYWASMGPYLAANVTGLSGLGFRYSRPMLPVYRSW